MNARLFKPPKELAPEQNEKPGQRPTYDEYFESRLSGYRKQIDRIDTEIFKFIVLRRRKFVLMAPSARDALYQATKNIEESETAERVKNAAQKISLPHEYMENIANILHEIIKLCGGFEAKGKIGGDLQWGLLPSKGGGFQPARCKTSSKLPGFVICFEELAVEMSTDGFGKCLETNGFDHLGNGNKGHFPNEMGELFKLIMKRAAIAARIGKLKKNANLPVENSERETEIIERLKPAAKKAALPEEDVEKIWREIFAFCKKIQIEKK